MTDITRFAVYLVPAAEDAFYGLGSAALGYDVRAGRDAPRLPEIDAAWTAKAGQYGFHCTLVEAFETDPGRWDDLEAEVQAVCACLSPHARLHLGGGRTEVWDGGEVIVRRYDGAEPVLVLHTLLLARLARFVTGSSFERKAREEGKYAEPHEQARLNLLRTPRGLDTFMPHFTLVEPYSGGDAEGLAERLDERFEPYPTLEFGSVALLRQEGTERFRIVREFPVGAGRRA